MKRKKLEILTEIANTSGLQNIADLCYELFGNPIVIIDTTMQPIVFSQNFSEEELEKINEILGGQKKVSNIFQSVEIRQSSKKNAIQNKAYICRDDNIPYARMVRNLVDGASSFGTIVMPEYFKPFDDEDTMYMDLVANFMSLPMRKQQYKLYSEWSLQQFMVWLLAGNKLSVSMENETAVFYNFFDKKYFYLLSIYSMDEEGGETLLNGLLEKLSEIKQSFCMIYKSRVLFLYNTDEKISNWNMKLPKLAEILHQWNLYSCVSQSFTRAETVYERFLQTDDMLEKACILRRKSRFLDYNEYIFYHMLDRTPEGMDLRFFCDERILDIEEYDKKHHTDLIPTLHTYLENTKSLTRTSEILYIHKNTANYRINKCMEITGCQYEHGDEIFSAIFSLRIIEYCNRKAGIGYEEEQ